MTILVTGGAGYIGSHCVKALLETHPVVVVDNLSTGHVRQTERFVELDIRNTDRLAEVMATHQVTAVLHFAASCYVGESVTDPAIYYHNNVYGTYSLLQAMRTAGVNRLIFSSSCATYGMPKTPYLAEDHPQHPVNPYGWTKRMVEQMLCDYVAAYELRTVSLRYFNAAGAHPDGTLRECHDPETHLIPLALQAVRGDIPELVVYGNDYPTPDGTCVRDYVHVCDLAQAHILALKYLLETDGPSEVFNIGSEHGYSVLEVLKTVEAVTGKPVPYRFGPRRPGDPPRLVASARKIKETLGYDPQYPELIDCVKTAWNALA
jgi:UDP-glucose-4-epimerase GalE